jgi:hypothetical protein
MELDISSSWEYPVLNNYLLLYVSYRWSNYLSR